MRAAPGRWRSALGRVARVRPTRRGVALLVAGAVLLTLGILGGLHDVVGLAAAALGAVLLPWLLHGLQRLDAGRGALEVSRRVTPHPVVRGERASTRLLVRPARPTAVAFERLVRIRLSEQAAHELAGSNGVRAKVVARPESIQVGYAVHPSRRGRWTLGPLLTTRTDPFGVVRTTLPLGGATVVAVWPRTTELEVRGGLLGDLDHAGTGARLAAPDDAVLREYVAGDDPRRVHWPSAARQGRLMVRTDEAAGVRPVSVLLDRALLPAAGEHRSVAGYRHDEGEWAIELAASLACSFAGSGHPVRLVPTTATGPGDAAFVSGPSGRTALLDQTIDLHGHRTAADADAALASTAHALRVTRAPGEVTFAVLAPRSADVLRELAALSAEAASCRAFVVAERSLFLDAAPTAAALRAAGWRVAVTEPGAAHDRAWARLAEVAA